MARHWCYTINNYTNAELEQLWRPDIYDYMVNGLEVGTEKTPHVQGYCTVKKKKTLSQMSKLIPRAHLEITRGTPIQASDYCKKDGVYREFGSLPLAKTEAATKKRKADYELAVSLAKQQKLYEVDPALLLRHGSNLRMICKDHPIKVAPLNYLPGIWLYGKSGIGKSRTARWLYPDAYDKPINKWWDGYQNEDYVILDDVDTGATCLGHHFKRWADHYDFPAEQKGTTIQIRPKIICVTSQYQPSEIWQGAMLDAIERRFQQIDIARCLGIPKVTPIKKTWDEMLVDDGYD